MNSRDFENPAGRRRAFTLMEAMFAVVIGAVGFAGGLQLITHTRSANALEQERGRALQIVNETMERLHYSLYPSIVSDSKQVVWDNDTPENKSDDTKGTLDVVVRDPDGNKITAAPTPARRVQVEVTLTWKSRAWYQTKTFRETKMTYFAP